MTNAQQTAPRSRVERHKTAYRVRALLAWLMTLLLLFGLFFAVFSFWLVPVRIAGGSMMPTLEDGQIVLIDRAAKHWKQPKRGDIAAFYDPASGGLLLRRIVALSGETVDVQDGFVYIDGCPLREDDYLGESFPAADSAAVTVPQNAVYVLADDRAYNGDSRDTAIGCIPLDKIKGILRIRLLPLEQFAVFG